ncbi:MAG: carboxypeptidase regulatory-like domain-containing protein [Anaerolineales bacterium]|nr:carboxypeptidase regulatory-like domain-containing protein [Anaerolineales bacterium]
MPNHAAVEVSPHIYPKISLPVSSLIPIPAIDTAPRILTSLGQEILPPTGNNTPDALASREGSGTTPAPLLTFEGIDGNGTIAPPDTVGDVGPNHYIQMVNVSFQIWDKGNPDQGIPPTILQPATPYNQLFTGHGGPCETQNDGAPTVLYDELADRWMLAQFVLSNPFEMCIAVSTTPDPMGTYYLYDFPMPANPDYPKLAAWSDAYYAGTNTGQPHEFFAHAFDRERMLAGLPATRQSTGNLDNFVMPADADGQIPPPAGSPGIFFTMYDHEESPIHPAGPDRLALYEFHVDWDNVDNSTFTLAQEIPVTSFNYTVCGYLVQDCIPQPGTDQKLDSLSYWPMFRFQYRNFGNFGALVGNFTVDVDGQGTAGIRWFELHQTNETFTLTQEGTFAPDGDHRWMGSIAMDKAGNLALGYNVSSEMTIPSLRYTSRLTTDPPGTLAAEAELWAGTGVQTGLNRWGDLSNLVVDPLDGCHFWFTGEYHDVDDSGFFWNTRVGVFQLPGCEGNRGTLAGQVIDGESGVSNVEIQARAYLTQTGSTNTDVFGNYQMLLPEGTYVVTATAFGYLPSVATGVGVVSGTLTSQNFTLSPAPVFVLSGTVTDSAGGWPIYTSLEIEGYPGSPVWTDPVTGAYQVTLPEGSYTFKIHPYHAGYLLLTEEILVEGNLTHDFAMIVDAVACIAPGYVFNGMRQGFDEGTLPFGWGVKDNIDDHEVPEVWLFDDPGGRGNLTGGIGLFAIMDSDYFGTTITVTAQQDSSLVTPFMDFTDLEHVYLTFDTDFKVWDGNSTNEKAQVDVSIDGGENWINVWQRDMEGGDFNGHVLVDLSSVAAHQPYVLLQFHYFDAQYDYWWQVDNIRVGALTCDPLPGGMVVGNVYDENFGYGINGAIISTSTNLTVISEATPEDPSLNDGFYTFFAPPEPITLTAYSPSYGTVTHVITVENGLTTAQDFTLPSGWLQTMPGEKILSLAFGYTATLPITLTNAGSITATFAITHDTGFTAIPPWIAPMPLSGTLGPEMNLPGVLTFSTFPITQTGTYTTHLIFTNNTPYDDLSFPLTLLAAPPAPSLSISPDQEGVGAPGTIFTYQVTLTNTGNVPETFTFQITNHVWEASVSLPHIFLNPANYTTFQVQITIPLTASYLSEDITALVIQGQETGISATTQFKTIARFPHLQFIPYIQR